MTQNRWAPTLPSFGGRLAPRVEISSSAGGSYNLRLQEYFLARQSCASMWSHPLSHGQCRRFLTTEHWKRICRGATPRPCVSDLRGPVAYKFLLATLGHISMSKHFQRKLSSLCEAGKIDLIKRWFQTTDGIVLALLLSVDDPDSYYQDIDMLIKFSMENCANNYSDFISKMKSIKRLLRKDYAQMTELSKQVSICATYRKMYEKHLPSDDSPVTRVRYLMCWTQTRASGMADHKMVEKSLDKCEATLSAQRRVQRIAPATMRSMADRSLPEGEPVLPSPLLSEMAHRVAMRVRGETAHVSTGPNACLESTRQEGGQSGQIFKLTRTRCLRVEYDHRDLTRTVLDIPRPVTSSKDLVDWAIQTCLERPTYVRCVRLHAVPEPSKARTITVCSLPYLVVVGVIAKLLQPSIVSDITRGGLHASRNLWNFLFNDLDPNLGLWGSLRDEPGGEILALSSDLSEATDYGDLGVARQIFHAVLTACADIPGFPLGLATLAKTLFIGKRYCLRYSEGRGYRYFVKRNGWLMGDRITKVILTLAHELVVRSSGLHTARICGDDIIAFSRSREKLERYLKEVERLGFKVSWEDSYISSRLAFYCEEACIPAQRFRELPAVCTRRKDQSMYVDYVRIRLLIPTHVESRAYSYTDTGRFALLGKECRWVHQGGLNAAIPIFTRGSLLQHLLVAQPSDTLCPYLPIEIGGDGAFPHSGDFLFEVLLQKSRDFRETYFRMSQLLTSKWGFRFVRSSNLNDVVHKYHILVPKIRELKRLLPQDAIVEGNEFLLSSIKVDGLESPEKTFFRIWRAWYWNQVFLGKNPPEIELGLDRHFPRDDTEITPDLKEVTRFFHVWRDRGFTFRDKPDYLVDISKIHSHDYLNMGWKFGFSKHERHARALELEPDRVRKLLNEDNIESFIDHLKEGLPVSPIVAETVFKYVESDSYILATKSRDWSKGEVPETVLLVTGDINLAVDLARVLVGARARRGDEYDNTYVIVVPPNLALYGMVGAIEKAFGLDEGAYDYVPDPGAIQYCAYMDSGLGVFFEEPCVRWSYARNSPATHVKVAWLEESLSSGSERVSLTTQLPRHLQEQFFPWLRVVSEEDQVRPLSAFARRGR